MRFLVLLLSAIAPSAGAPPPDLLRFEQALARSDINDAAVVVDQLIAQHTPQDGKPRPDPLLNALLGRLYLTAREPSAALTYLDQAPVAALPPGMRAATARDHGRALELSGRRASALAAYRDAAAAGTSEEDRRVATLGIARQLLPDDPMTARTEVQPIADGAPEPQRWQARSLMAIASSVLGDPQSASRYADEAWQDSISAPLNSLAPLHVATLRAGLAAARNDIATERAMLTTANGLSVSASSELSSRMPVCGDRGLQPSDYVIFAFVTGPYLVHDLFPIAASRSEAVAPFQDALGSISPIKIENMKPVGTVFTAACRSVVSADHVESDALGDPLLSWMVATGIYPASASSESDDKHLNAIGNRIDALTAKFGDESPLLIGPRWQTLTILERRAAAGDPVLPGQLTDLEKQIAEGMRRAGAPEWIARSIEMRRQYRQAAAARVADPTQANILFDLAKEQLARTPFDFARPLFFDWMSRLRGDWPVAASQILLDLDASAPTTLAGGDRQAWKISVARAQRALGKEREARATLASAGLPRGVCLLNDSEPTLLEQHFSYNDYPPVLIAGEQEGSVFFEFDLSPSGTLAGHRIIYSLPSLLFDQPSAQGLAAVRYTVPTRSGRPAGCSAVYQPIIWRLEDNQNFDVPTLQPDIGPTT